MRPSRMRREMALNDCRALSRSPSPAETLAPGSRKARSICERPSFAREIREVGPENAAPAPHHVATRAVSLPGEIPFAGRRVARRRVVCGRRPQHFKESDQRIELGVRHRERRHRRVGDPVADQVTQRHLRRGARPADIDDGRAVPAAGPVGPVAADAARFVGAPAGLERLPERGGTRNRERGGHQQECPLHVTRHCGSVTAGLPDRATAARTGYHRPATMIGETLGQYRIESRLGSGGMGVVYKAHDERLHRSVAIKLIGGEGRGSTPDERARLLDEARAASHLTHPHICTVYEVGELDGRVFIAMEFVEGQPLSQLVPADGLPAETVVRYGEQIAAALAHAHERGVIHRDSEKRERGASGQEARQRFSTSASRAERRPRRPRSHAGEHDGRSGRSHRHARVCCARGAAGTRRGRPHRHLGARGRLVRAGHRGAALPGAQRIRPHRRRFSGSPAQPFPAHVPPILRAIILRCLAKEPSQRYQRAGEVRAALEAIHSDLIVSAPLDAGRDARGRHGSSPPRPSRSASSRWRRG